MYMRYNLAWIVLAFFNAREEALDLLAPALAKSGKNLISLADADLNLDALRNDPRFQQMIKAAKKRLGLLPKPISPPAAAPRRRS